jgi:hypothetical protein
MEFGHRSTPCISGRNRLTDYPVKPNVSKHSLVGGEHSTRKSMAAISDDGSLFVECASELRESTSLESHTVPSPAPSSPGSDENEGVAGADEAQHVLMGDRV